MTGQPNRPPEFEIPAGLAAVYTNLARISHTPAELVFDIAEWLPGEPQARVVSRLIMSPVGAKLFCRALMENLARYEAAFGEIHLPGEDTLASGLFGGMRPPDTQR